MSCKQSKSAHQKICKNKQTLISTELQEFKNNILELLQKNAKIHPKTLQKLINNNTNNNTMNNTMTNNITIKFGSENLAEILGDKEMQTILSRCRKSIEESNFQKKIYIFFEKVISYN